MGKIVSDDDVLIFEDSKNGKFELYLLSQNRDEVKTLDEYENGTKGHKVWRTHKKVVMDRYIETSAVSTLGIFGEGPIVFPIKHIRKGNIYQMLGTMDKVKLLPIDQYLKEKMKDYDKALRQDFLKKSIDSFVNKDKKDEDNFRELIKKVLTDKKHNFHYYFDYDELKKFVEFEKNEIIVSKQARERYEKEKNEDILKF